MGVAVVEALVKQGWAVTIVDIDQTLGNQVASSLGDQVLFVCANVASFEQQVNAFKQTWARWGRLDFGTFSKLPHEIHGR